MNGLLILIGFGSWIAFVLTIFVYVSHRRWVRVEQSRQSTRQERKQIRKTFTRYDSGTDELYIVASNSIADSVNSIINNDTTIGQHVHIVLEVDNIYHIPADIDGYKIYSLEELWTEVNSQ